MPSVHKDNSKFEILLAKIFSLRQKANQILSAILGKIKFCLLKKTDQRDYNEEI